MAWQATPSEHADNDGVSQHGHSWPRATTFACMAFMQSLKVSSSVGLVEAFMAMLATICWVAQAELIGASDRDRATRIAIMVRKRCRTLNPFKQVFV